MKHYRVLKPFDTNAVGAVIELEDDVVKGLLLSKSIEEVVIDESAAAFRKEMQAKLSKVAEDAAKVGAQKAMDQMRATVAGVRIEMGESEVDKLRKTGGFKSFGHFAYDLYKAGPDGRGASETLRKYADAFTKAPSGLNEGVDSEGAYLVPTEQASLMLEKATEDMIVRPRATIMPMNTNKLDVPVVKDESRSTTLFGGISIYRKPEGAQASGSKPTFQKVELKLTKLVGLCYVTEELLNDSPVSLEPMLNKQFPKAIAFTRDYQHLQGSGVGEPLGALHASNPCLVAVAKETGQSATTIVVENLINMYARCYGKNSAVWVANHNTFPQLATMAMKVGTGGVPVWLAGNSAAGAPYGTLFGRPLILSELVPTLGAQGDIALCDFSQYLVGERAGEGLQVATSIHLRFDYDEVAYRFTMRDDGQPWWKAALTPKVGATLSPFVVVAVRS